MPLIFDSVFIAALARELDARWSGRRLEGVRFDRAARHVTIDLGDETWLWLLHPLEGVLVRRAAAADASAGRRAGGRPPGGRGLLDGPRRVLRVASPADTRQLFLALAGPGDGDERLVLDLVTNRWNALYVVDREVRSVLVGDLGRDPVAPGDAWHPAVSDRRWAAADAAPDLGAWISMLRELAPPDGEPARRRVAWLSGSNEAAVLGEAMAGGLVDPDGAQRSLARYLGLRDAALRDVPKGWMLPGTDGSGRPYVTSLGIPGAERIGSVLDALAAWAEGSTRIEQSLRAAGEPAATAALRAALEERRSRIAKKIRALRAEVDEAAGDPDELRQLGHLLLARKADVPAGAEEARLEGFSGEPVTVPLDPALDAVGNAELYYDRAKRRERAARQLPERLAKAERRLVRMDEALERLAAGEPDESDWNLAGGKRKLPGRERGGAGERDARPERLPYRVYRTSSGREIRAGRSAKANDELTFRHSAPDDIWMHVREAPGSHVVLRWGRKEQNPPEADIADAALVAAVLSRARGSSVVPVAWTRRKYVRKPRKAPPGSVVPERTRTIFVEPDARRVAKMAEED